MRCTRILLFMLIAALALPAAAAPVDERQFTKRMPSVTQRYLAMTSPRWSRGPIPSEKLDLAMTFWVLERLGRPDRPGRRWVLSARDHEAQGCRRLHPARQGTRKAGNQTEEVTDIVISHMHWDHADGVDLFPKAQIWIQKNEYGASAGADRKNSRR